MSFTQSSQLYPHPHAGTHTPPPSYIRTTLHTHTHTHTPLHTLTHTAVTPTHAHPSNYIRTTCAHPYTYLQLSTNINSLQLSQYLFTNISKYPHMHTFKNICKYPHCHTIVPINCTNAQIVVVNCQLLQKSSKSIACQLQYIHSFFLFLIPELKEYKLYKCWVHPATRTRDLKSKLGCDTN